MTRTALALAAALAASAASASTTTWTIFASEGENVLALRAADGDGDGRIARDELALPSYAFLSDGGPDGMVSAFGDVVTALDLAVQQNTIDVGSVAFTGEDGATYDFATAFGPSPLRWTPFIAQATVPLPATAPLVLAGLAALTLVARRRKR